MKSVVFFDEVQVFFNNDQKVTNQPDEGQLVYFHGSDMQGLMQKIEVEPGISVYRWEIAILQPTIVTATFPAEADDKVICLYYYFHSLSHPVTFSVQEKDFISKNNPFLFIYSTDTPLTVTFPSAMECKLISIRFTKSWLYKQLYTLKKNEAASDYVLQVLQHSFLRTLTTGEKIHAQDLFKEMASASFLLEIKAHTYNLITFLYRYVKIKANEDGKDVYRSLISRVEKKILASLYTNLPPLNDLAKEFHMSFSSLNRHFKAQYGATIYDYYLQHKMALAEKLLKEGNQSVNAVAFQLGYESATHFISMFKKLQGYPPGQIKREME